MKKNLFKKSISLFLTVLMVLSCWVWFTPAEKLEAEAASNITIYYPITISFTVTTKLSNGGNMAVGFYPVNDDGTLDTSAGIQMYTVSTSLSNDGYSSTGSYTITKDVPGFPVQLQIVVASDTWSNPALKLTDFKVGTRSVLNGWSGTTKEQTRNWYQSEGGMDSITYDWPNPSWAVKTATSSSSIQVPTYGTRTASGCTTVFYDSNYNVTFPQANVSYSVSPSAGITLTQNSGVLSSIAVDPKAINNFSSTDTSGTKNVTLTASGAGKTSTANITLKAPQKEVLYEGNLFCLSDWYYSDSSKWSDSNIVTDLSAGTVKITNPTTDSSSEYTTLATTGTHPSNYYSVPVVAGNTYYFTCKTANATSTEVFFMWKDTNGAALTDATSGNVHPSKYFSGDGYQWAEFTAPENATQVEIRLDNNTDGTTVTFSDIAIYEKTAADAVDLKNWPTRPVRKMYTYNATSAASAGLDTPSRIGYSFNGWMTTSGGTTTFPATQMSSNQAAYSSWTAIPYDIGFDNIFSLAEWSKTSSTLPNNSSNGTVSYDVEKGTITVESTATSEVYTKYSGTGDYYRMEVEPNTEYVFETTMAFETQASGGSGQMFVFFYDANGSGLTGSIYNGTTQANPHIGMYPGSGGTQKMTFTTPAGCTQIGIRVAATKPGDKVTYSDIGVYEKTAYDAYASNYTTVRLPYYYGDTDALQNPPAREGYTFSHWEDGEGNKVESVSGLYASDTVYAVWTQLYLVTFYNYDGTKLYSTYVYPGDTAVYGGGTPEKAADSDYEYEYLGWNKALTNITADTDVTAQFQTKDHTITTTTAAAATCTAYGTVYKYCENCGYDWGIVQDDSAAPLGHNYTRLVNNSSTGVDGVHTMRCSRCADTTTVAHSYNLNSNQSASDATCIKQGETYYICACGQEKTVYGNTNPNNHVNTTQVNYVAPNCTTPGKDYDTYCNDCKQTVATGSEIPATGHTWENTTKYPTDTVATCTVDAVYYQECSVCGISSEGQSTGTTWTDVDSKLGHSFTNYTYNYNATCEENGTETATCDRCDETNTRTKENTALGHDYDGGTIRCNNDGTHSYKCVNFDDCDSYGNTTDCTYGSWTKNNATTHSHTCTACGYTPAAEAHQWSDWETTDESNTTAAGKQTRKCEVCSRVETVDCTYTSVTTAATCTKDSYTTYTCSDCGHGYTVIHTATATGHDFSGDYTYDADSDKHQRACVNNDCTAKGVDGVADAYASCVWSYANKETGKHIATCVCGNSEVQNCTGGTATCTALAVCENCNTAYGEKADHIYTGCTEYLYKAEDATCITNETYYYYCIGCKITVDGIGTYEKPDTMTAHDYTCKDEYLYIATQAKCGVNETYYAYCSNSACKKSSEDAANTYEKADTGLTHSWVNPVDNNNGTHTLSCSNTNTDGWSCDETLTLNCADSAITYGYTAPTCISQGYTTYQCTACSYTWDADYEEVLGHDYSEKVYNEAHLKEDANCEHAKIYWYDCSRCDKNAKDETDTDKYTVLTFTSGNVRAHDFQNQVDEKYLATAATCTAAATYYTSCAYSDCGKSSYEVYGETGAVTFTNGTSLGHDWVHPADDVLASYQVVEPDCITDATYYYVCSRCDISSEGVKKDGETWTDEGSKTGHNLTHYEAVAATCLTDGSIEYWSCSKCNKNFSDAQATTVVNKTVVDKLGHDWIKYSFKAQTCEEDGHSAYEECSRCAEQKNYTKYNKKGHDFTGVYTYDAVLAVHSKLCINDGCTASGIVDADGNDVKFEVTYNENDEAVITGAEKCDFSGEEVHYVDEDGNHCHAIVCKCGNKIGEYCSDSDPVVTAPTCLADGYTTNVCDDCGYEWKSDIVATTGHDWAEKATSNGNGTHSVGCSKCDATKDTVKCSGGTATCKDYAVCSLCGGTYGSKVDHTLASDGWTSNNDATCTVDGTEWQICSVCNETVTRTQEDSAIGHSMSAHGYVLPEGWDAPDFDETKVVAPDCKNEGLSISYCQNEDCLYYETKVVKADKTAHVWPTDADGNEIWETVGGNCATGVTMQKVCTVCGTKKTENVAAPHNWVEQVRVEANCVADGYIIYQCSVCSFTKQYDSSYVLTDDEGNIVEQFPIFNGVDTGLTLKLGHSWEREGGENQALVVDKEATCGQMGRGHYVCSVCQTSSDYIDIAKIPHAWDLDSDGITDEGFTPDMLSYHDGLYVEASAATCQYNGHEGYYKCYKCSYDQHLDSKWNGNTAKLDHVDGNTDGKCDECNTKLYDTDDGSNKNCDCICHKDSWIMKIIYKILRFFWKLFGIGKSCDCGATHY